MGSGLERRFTEKAVASGLTEEEAKFAFNRNMMSGGVLNQGPIAFGSEHGKRWLVTAYEARDVVLHNLYMVSTNNHEDVVEHCN